MGLLATEAFQTVANQGREGKQRQGRNSQETIWQPWGRVGVPLQGMLACVRAVTSVVFDSETLWTVARQASLSMGSSRQEYWSGLPFPPPGDLLNPGIEHVSCGSCTTGRFFTTEPPGKLPLKGYTEQFL